VGEGAFRILEVLSSGQSGIVCVCEMVASAEKPLVAVKVLRADLEGGEMEDRLRDEAKMLSRLSHWNIVSVENLYQIEGRPCFVMEWVDGVNVTRLLREHPEGLPTEVALELARETANALDAAHHTPSPLDGRPMKIIHRDINPSNIMMSVDGSTKVIDFGIAKADFRDREAVTSVMVKGTRAYSAPERDEGLPDTPAVDVYALGITLFELLTGKPLVLPRSDENHAPALLKQLGYLECEGLEPEVLARIRSLIAAMCSLDPNARPKPAAVASGLGAIMAEAYLLPDLAGFARSQVAPIRQVLKSVPPSQHPDWEQIRILQEALPDETIRPPRPRVRRPSADKAVRKFLRRSGWHQDMSGLRQLLTGDASWTERPFVEMLNRASRPWWQFWSPSPSGPEVAAALEVLRYRANAHVLDRAKTLCAHRDAAVASAAKTWLERVQ